ncbi:redox-regulated ATPase YchF [Candidatus Woesearchaeota archaeon]|nr:redox-regulated ATPase YchF [Candidatus Woesearchaeota archaeon]
MLIGVVGKANVGKSTFFKSITLADILIANYPFATIDPNKGFAFVRIDCVDKEFNQQCNPRFGSCVNHQRFVPVEVMDVAGLVPGAHLGKGMGLTFLDDLRQADAFVHVVDMAGSTNEKGEPVEPGSYDPAHDIRFLEIELDMWVYGIITKGWEKLSRALQQEKGAVVKALAKQLSGLNISEGLVESLVKQLKLDPLLPAAWTEEQIKELAVVIRKKSKPMVIAANKMDLPTAKANVERMKKLFPDLIIIPVSAEAELTLRQASKAGLIDYLPGDKTFTLKGNVNPKQKEALDYIHKTVLDVWGSTGVQQTLNTAVFDLLHFMAIFPGGVNRLADKDGNILPDCFLLPPGSTAYDFAAKIHTDLATHFVAAMDVKTKRKIGRETLLKHRDVVEILTSK